MPVQSYSLPRLLFLLVLFKVLRPPSVRREFLLLPAESIVHRGSFPVRLPSLLPFPPVFGGQLSESLLPIPRSFSPPSDRGGCLFEDPLFCEA